MGDRVAYFTMRMQAKKARLGIEWRPSDPTKDAIVGPLVYSIEIPESLALIYTAQGLYDLLLTGHLHNLIRQHKREKSVLKEPKRKISAKMTARVKILKDIIDQSAFDGERDAARTQYKKITGKEYNGAE